MEYGSIEDQAPPRREARRTHATAARSALLCGVIGAVLLCAQRRGGGAAARAALARTRMPTADDFVDNVDVVGDNRSLAVSVRTKGYDALSQHTLNFYRRWDRVVEPHRATLLEVTRPRAGATYTWTIRHISTGLAVEKTGATVEHEFEAVRDYYELRVHERRAGGGAARELAHLPSVVCKHVRREVRTLNPSDRERYLEALEVFHTISHADGAAAYGSSFRNGAYFAALHNAKDYCYHNNLVFLTSHPAFNLQVDEMLHMIDPLAPRVYWDFMIDHKYGATWYKDSPIYAEDWFGTLDNGPDDDYRIRGRFRDVMNSWNPSNKSEPTWTEHSPYGFVSSPYATSDALYLQRTNHFCGMPSTQPFASCGRLVHCMENATSDLLTWDLCVENHIHANLHGLHGGYWRCADDLANFSADHAWASDALLSFTVANIAEEVLTKPGSLFPFLDCPTSCTVGVDTYETCHCNSTVPPVDTLDDDAVYDYLEWALAKMHEGYLGDHFMTKNHSTGEHIFKHITTDQDRELKRLYLRLLREPGNFGVFATGAAANDPLFWPMHPIFDKMTQALRMAPALSASMNFTWDNSGTSCGEGVEWNDVLPFEDLFWGANSTGTSAASLGSKDLAGAYTNRDIWELFQPDGDWIPYVYDQLENWGECDWDPLSYPMNSTR